MRYSRYNAFIITVVFLPILFLSCAISSGISKEETNQIISRKIDEGADLNFLFDHIKFDFEDTVDNIYANYSEIFDESALLEKTLKEELNQNTSSNINVFYSDNDLIYSKSDRQELISQNALTGLAIIVYPVYESNTGIRARGGGYDFQINSELKLSFYFVDCQTNNILSNKIFGLVVANDSIRIKPLDVYFDGFLHDKTFVYGVTNPIGAIVDLVTEDDSLEGKFFKTEEAQKATVILINEMIKEYKGATGDYSESLKYLYKNLTHGQFSENEKEPSRLFSEAIKQIIEKYY